MPQLGQGLSGAPLPPVYMYKNPLGCLLKMQIPGPHSGPTKYKSMIRCGTRICILISAPEDSYEA